MQVKRGVLCGLWFPFPRKRLFYLLYALVIRLGQALQKPIRAHAQHLADSGKSGHRELKLSAFDVAHRLPVNSDQLRQTLLREIGLETGHFHVLANEPQYLTVSHPLIESRFNSPLTSNMFDVK